MSAAWLRETGACTPQFLRFAERFGQEEIAVTAESVAAAREAGLDLLWIGTMLATPEQRRRFVTFTIEQRRAALEQLLGEPATSADELRLRELAAAAWADWCETGNIQARSLGIALREAARDMTVLAPSAEQARQAALAALRALSYSGEEDQRPFRLAQEDWLAAELTEDGA